MSFDVQSSVSVQTTTGSSTRVTASTSSPGGSGTRMTTRPATKAPASEQTYGDRFRAYVNASSQLRLGVSLAPQNFLAAEQNFARGRYLAGLSDLYTGIDQASTGVQGALNLGSQFATDTGRPELAKGTKDLAGDLLTAQTVMNAFARPLSATRQFLDILDDPKFNADDKVNAFLNIASTALNYGGSAILVGAKAAEVSSPFLRALGNNLKNAGAAGQSWAGLQKSLDDFDTAYRDNDTMGMVRAVPRIVLRGAALGRVISDVLANGFKDSGMTVAQKFFEYSSASLGAVSTANAAFDSELGYLAKLGV